MRPAAGAAARTRSGAITELVSAAMAVSASVLKRLGAATSLLIRVPDFRCALRELGHRPSCRLRAALLAAERVRAPHPTPDARLREIRSEKRTLVSTFIACLDAAHTRGPPPGGVSSGSGVERRGAPVLRAAPAALSRAEPRGRRPLARLR